LIYFVLILFFLKLLSVFWKVSWTKLQIRAGDSGRRWSNGKGKRKKTAKEIYMLFKCEKTSDSLVVFTMRNKGIVSISLVFCVSDAKSIWSLCQQDVIECDFWSRKVAATVRLWCIWHQKCYFWRDFFKNEF